MGETPWEGLVRAVSDILSLSKDTRVQQYEAIGRCTGEPGLIITHYEVQLNTLRGSMVYDPSIRRTYHRNIRQVSSVFEEPLSN